MVNYINGKVYMIEPTVEILDDGDIYIGSTCKENISQRRDTHRQAYRQKQNGGKVGNTTSYALFDKYGIVNCKITLLEVCLCNSRDQLIARESHYIRTMKCVNKTVPDRTRDEWKDENREQYIIIRKEYRETNKGKIFLSKRIFFQCECSITCQLHAKRKHERSKKHLKFVAEKKSTKEDLSLCRESLVES
jgi:ribosome-interacting GTPase 1